MNETPEIGKLSLGEARQIHHKERKEKAAELSMNYSHLGVGSNKGSELQGSQSQSNRDPTHQVFAGPRGPLPYQSGCSG